MTPYDPYTAQAQSHVETPEEFEKEKAAITSYEEGWDDWDGFTWGYETMTFDEAPDDKDTAQHHHTPCTDRSQSPVSGLGDH